MPDLTIDITWYKDPKGYRLVPAKPIKLRPGQSLLDVPYTRLSPPGLFVTAASFNRIARWKFQILVGRFIRMATSESGLLAFIEKYGPLTFDGLRGKGDNVPAIIDQAKAMLRPGHTSLNKLNASIVIDYGEMRLKVWPACLLDALWLNVAQKNIRSKECQQCHKPFVDRRRDAKFCSDQCRIAFNSLKRSR